MMTAKVGILLLHRLLLPQGRGLEFGGLSVYPRTARGRFQLQQLRRNLLLNRRAFNPRRRAALLGLGRGVRVSRRHRQNQRQGQAFRPCQL